MSLPTATSPQGTHTIIKWNKTYTHTIISIGLMLFFRFIPPVAPLTAFGMTIIGIFAGTIYGWCACDGIWPSFACILVLGLTTKYITVTNAVVAGGSNSSVLTIMFVLFVTAIVQLTGTGEWVGRWFVSRPFLKGKPLLMIIFLFLTNFIVGPFLGMACFMLLWDVVAVINEQIGLEKKSRFSQLLVYCILFNSQVSLWLLHQQGFVTSSGLYQGYIKGFQFQSYPLIILGLVNAICLITASFIGVYFVFKPDLSLLKNSSINLQPPGKIERRHIITIYMVVCYVAMQVLPSVLPKAWEVTKFLNQFGVIGISMAFTVFALILHIDGKPFVTFSAIQKRANWSVMFMPAVANIVATALTTKDTGVTQILSNFFTPLFSHVSAYAFFVIIAISAMVLTNFINNIVVIALFLPVIFTMGPVVGANINAMLPVLTFSSYLAVMLPSANPMAAVLHANTEQVETKEIIKFSIVSMATSAVVFAFITIPLANFLYK